MVVVSEISAGVGGRKKGLEIVDLSERCILYCFVTMWHTAGYTASLSLL